MDHTFQLQGQKTSLPAAQGIGRFITPSVSITPETVASIFTQYKDSNQTVKALLPPFSDLGVFGVTKRYQCRLFLLHDL